jgi:hypothetical protein
MFTALCRRRNIHFKYERYANAITASAVYNCNRASADAPILTAFDFVKEVDPEREQTEKIRRLIKEVVAHMPNSTTAYTQSQTVELAMNIAYPIVVEWQHGSGANYECQLLWTPPNTTTPVVIPTANLSLTGKWWNGTSADWYPTTWY